jgi:hypothetical protein
VPVVHGGPSAAGAGPSAAAAASSSAKRSRAAAASHGRLAELCAAVDLVPAVPAPAPAPAPAPVQLPRASWLDVADVNESRVQAVAALNQYMQEQMSLLARAHTPPLAWQQLRLQASQIEALRCSAADRVMCDEVEESQRRGMSIDWFTNAVTRVARRNELVRAHLQLFPFE